VAVVFLGAAGGAMFAGPPARSAAPLAALDEKPVIVVRAYEHGVSGIHAANPDVKLSVGRDSALAGELVLLVDYPQPTGDPAGRDVWCDAETTDWTAGRAISFRVKPAAPVKLSLSFLDRNRVAYTTWIELQGGAWQPVQVSFDQMRPNPYFQPPDAKTGLPIDVTEVRSIGFAPQDRTAGHFAISKFVVIE
jgi:hypothetical protein